MSSGIRSDASGTFGALTFGGYDVLRFGSDNSGQLAGFRNILINGDMRINQRGVTIATAANGAYGPDRWKKVDASNMTQIVESGNFVPSATYTLSGTGVTTQQITSPASGNWTLPNIPIVATNVQLEEGSIATPFEHRPIGLELELCQRYYEKSFTTDTTPANGPSGTAFVDPSNATVLNATHRVFFGDSTYHVVYPFKVQKKVTPTVVLYGNSSGAGVLLGGVSGTPSWTKALIGVAATVNGLYVANEVYSTTAFGYYTCHWTASAEL